MDIIEQYKSTRNLLFKQAEIDPESKFIEINGPVKKIHYLELGQGDPLILVHGGLSHSSEWINILKPLSAHFHLFVVDRPGHGLSDAMDYRGIDYQASAVLFMNSLMTALGLEKAFLMGNSMGGYFALCFALEYPEKVSKLILIGAPAGMNKWIPPILRLLGVSRLNRLLLKTVAKPSIKSARDIHKKLLVADVNKISLNLLEHTRQNQSLPGAMIAHTSLLENVLTLRGWKDELYLGNKLDRLEMQVHFIWGEQDAFESPETGKPKAASIKNYSFEIIKNAGHCPWLDQPGVCVASALRFLDNS